MENNTRVNGRKTLLELETGLCADFKQVCSITLKKMSKKQRYRTRRQELKTGSCADFKQVCSITLKNKQKQRYRTMM